MLGTFWPLRFHWFSHLPRSPRGRPFNKAYLHVRFSGDSSVLLWEVWLWTMWDITTQLIPNTKTHNPMVFKCFICFNSKGKLYWYSWYSKFCLNSISCPVTNGNTSTLQHSHSYTHIQFDLCIELSSRKVPESAGSPVWRPWSPLQSSFWISDLYLFIQISQLIWLRDCSMTGAACGGKMLIVPEHVISPTCFP